MAKRANAKPKLNRSAGGNAAVIIFLFVMSVLFLFPLLYAVANSFKPIDELLIFPPRIYVVHPTWENYRELFRLASNAVVPLTRYLFNTLVVSLSITAGTIIISSITAFPLTFGNFPGKDKIFSLIVTSLLFVGTVTAAPSYIVISKLRLLNTYWAIILPALAASLGVFLMKQFMEQIPYAVVEAANVDGCNEFQTLFKIVFPLVKPAWLTLCIFVFPTAWANTGGSYIFADRFKLLPVAFTEITAGATIARMGVSATVGIIMLLPSLILFIITQSSVLETMATAGIKE